MKKKEDNPSSMNHGASSGCTTPLDNPSCYSWVPYKHVPPNQVDLLRLEIAILKEKIERGLL